MVENIEPILRRTAIQADTRWCVIYPRALPPVTYSSALQAPERLREACDVDTYSLAYCLPGRGLVVGYLYPRALPSVTHGSAFQAPERMRGSGDMDTLQAEECLWFFMM